jgi:hypothetical protein
MIWLTPFDLLTKQTSCKVFLRGVSLTSPSTSKYPSHTHTTKGAQRKIQIRRIQVQI